MAGNKLTGMAREVAEKYRETLVTLTFNDKIRINTLTEIAKEDQKYANVIVDCIEARLRKVSTQVLENHAISLSWCFLILSRKAFQLHEWCVLFPLFLTILL